MICCHVLPFSQLGGKCLCMQRKCFVLKEHFDLKSFDAPITNVKFQWPPLLLCLTGFHTHFRSLSPPINWLCGFLHVCWRHCFCGWFFFFYFYFFGLYFRLLYLNFLKGLLCKTSILPVCLRHPMAIIVGCLSCLLFACLLFIAFLLRLVFFPLLEHFFFNILLV